MLLLFLACNIGIEDVPMSPSSAETDVPMVALITIDTWRYDHFSAEHTPNLWALASQGERFDQAYSPMGLTTPAHASMLTGLATWEHGVEANNHHGYVLREDIPVLPQMFPGWASGAFVSAYPAGPEGGLRRGWDVFDGPESGERAGTVAISRAIDWLPSDQPALLWVHLYEPHGPYVGRGADERSRYAEEVRLSDTMLGPLLKVLQKRGATIVVTSDHGEVLDEERCSYQHERSISDHVLRVPTFRWSPNITASVNTTMVGLSDVPALLRGEAPDVRQLWVAQSGMCESDCAPGCTPAGIHGRDTLVISESGSWVQRPGRGVFSRGTPPPEARTRLAEVPKVREPENAANDRARSLGYIDP